MFSREKLMHFIPTAFLIVCGLSLSWVTQHVDMVANIFAGVPTGLYLAVGLIFALGYALNFVAPKTSVPSFVWAILFGMALQRPLAVLTGDTDALLIVVELLAAFVLFAGGVEVPFSSFKKHFAPIAMLSIVGTVLTVFLFALSLEWIAPSLGVTISAATLLLTAAILASTDPTAIIPTLRTLHLHKPALRDIAISESAVNDVTGTIITRFFLVASLTTASSATVIAGFVPLLERSTLDSLALEVLWGVIVGMLGAGILGAWSKSLMRARRPNADPALFFAVPIVMFALGSIVGGSGFLAAFIAGLLFDGGVKTAAVKEFFEMFVDGFIKPVIFVLLGAVVPLTALFDSVALGIVAAALFMLVVRPAIVFATLSPFMLTHRSFFSWRELVFLSFIRETGAIPAILILVAVASGVVGSTYVFAIGMWVILLTLIIEPPLTPTIAAKIGVVRT
jgi:cell volume regulation protein A